MELRDVLKIMRSELGINQSELANALHVSFATVNRWEAGKTSPNRSILPVLLEYANANALSKECTDMLREAVANASRAKIQQKNNLYSVEHNSLSQLIDDASFPIYVCDMETDDLLYINHKAEVLLGGTLEQLHGKKCYECIMHRTSACPECHKNQFTDKRFVEFSAYWPLENTFHIVRGKLIQWNGRKAQVRYVVDLDTSLNTAPKTADAVTIENIAKRIFDIDYETISIIDAATGQVQPSMGTHIHDVIAAQREAGDNVAGVAAYLLKYCVDDDVESVIRCTSLDYVKYQLKNKRVYRTSYAVEQEGKVIRKRVIYTYMDDKKTKLLCAIQNVT